MRGKIVVSDIKRIGFTTTNKGNCLTKRIEIHMKLYERKQGDSML